MKCSFSILMPLLLFGSLAVSLPLAGQSLDLPYSSSSTGEDGPFVVPPFAQPGERGCMAYDPVRQECVYFGGGSSQSNTYHGTTWTWNGAAWTVKTPAASPPARMGGVMAFDPVHGEALLFGGRGADGQLLNDTWAWNGTTWTAKSPATTPSIREGAAMTWDDERDEIVLFGGGLPGDQKSNETWTWNGIVWTLKTPPASPPANVWHAMAYDAAHTQIVLFCDPSVYTAGSTWTWNGATWNHRQTDGNVASRRPGASMVYSPAHSAVLLFGGTYNVGSYPSISTIYSAELFIWDDTVSAWKVLPAEGSATGRAYGVAAYDAARGEVVFSHGFPAADTTVLRGNFCFGRAGNSYTFDLGTKTDAVWNFTSINIPSGCTVNFKKNAANTGVLWLASENVNINGKIDVSGGGGATIYSPLIATGGVGGPGGFDGGQPGEPGQGPGAGPAGPSPASDGLHADASGGGPYGNLFAQPAVGGSGGGGKFGSPYANGGGGGGGGAVVIASSRDIALNGTISALGGAGGGNNGPRAGSGSCGLIRLVADRVIFGPAALLEAVMPFSDSNPVGQGRLRVEAYVRQIPNPAGQLRGSSSLSVPVVGTVLTQAGGRLVFRKVAGANVANPPKGDELNPDVTFSANGPVEIEVESFNIPDGTPVTVTLKHSLAGTITVGPVPLVHWRARFTATIPAGSGKMEASATYDVGGPEGDGEP